MLVSNATPMTTTSASPTPVPAAPVAPVSGDPRAGGGIQGVIGDLIRSGAAGYQAATHQTGVQAEKAAIHPFETVATATGLLKEKTAGIKGVGKATSILHTIGGFALLIMTANATSTLKAPGETAVDVGNRVADMIDGKDTAEGWAIGWGVRSGGDQPEDGDEAGGPSSLIGATLAASGVK